MDRSSQNDQDFSETLDYASSFDGAHDMVSIYDLYRQSKKHEPPEEIRVLSFECTSEPKSVWNGKGIAVFHGDDLRAFSSHRGRSVFRAFIKNSKLGRAERASMSKSKSPVPEDGWRACTPSELKYVKHLLRKLLTEGFNFGQADPELKLSAKKLKLLPAS